MDDDDPEELDFLSELVLTECAVDGDDSSLTWVAMTGLKAGFYLSQRHPEYLAKLVLDDNATIDADIRAQAPDFDLEGEHWEELVDELVEKYPLKDRE